MRSTPFLTLIAVLATASSPAHAADSIRAIDPDDATGSSRAVVVGDVPLAHTTQLLPLDATGKLVGVGRPAVQAERVLDNLARALGQAQSGLDRLARLNVYVARAEDWPAVQRVIATRFAGKNKPAISTVITRLSQASALVAMDAVAVSGTNSRGGVQLLAARQLATSEEMPVAILPPGSRIYVAGQAEKGKDLAEATRRTLESLRATLRFLGRNESDIVQLKAFVTPVTDVATVHRELALFFTKAPVPPVVFVEWQSTLPIEIELIAWGGHDRKGPAVEYLTPPGMTASPIYSRVARTNSTDLIYIAGLQAREAANGEAEVKEVFDALGTLLPRVGSDFRHLVKATYYVATDEASRKLNELRPRYYDPKRPPSASKATVAGVGRPGRGLSVDMIAVPSGK